jgi:hypothetical protein
MKPELESLDPDILALLDRAKTVPALDAAKKAALLADVMGKIGTLPPGGGGDGGGGGGGAGGAGGAGVGTGAALGSKVALGIAFAVGVAAGVVGDRAVGDRTPTPSATSSSVTTVVIPAVSALPPESPDAVPVGELPSAPVPSAAPPPPKSATSEPVPSARGLAAERALLDVSRAALARGEASEALDAAERHRRGYPDGALVEEREAIAIKALVALGRRDEAAQRLAHLEKTHPNSMVLRAAKKAVSGAP